MPLKFCSCGNIMETVVLAAGVSFNKCTACTSQEPLGKGDTLLRTTVNKPSGYDKYKHIIHNMHNVPAIPYVGGDNNGRDRNNVKCYKCNCKFIKYIILDNTTYYKCANSNCLQMLDGEKLILPESG